MNEDHGTALERQIRSQPSEIDQSLSSPTTREQVHLAAEGLHRAGVCGSSARAPKPACRRARRRDADESRPCRSRRPAMQFVTQAPVIAPRDGVIVIHAKGEDRPTLAVRSHSPSPADSTRSRSRSAARISPERSRRSTPRPQTYRSTTTAPRGARPDRTRAGRRIVLRGGTLVRAAQIQAAIDDPGIDPVPRPVGCSSSREAGPAGVTAREGGVEDPRGRTLAEGYDVEYLLHGSAVPLDGVIAGDARAARRAARIGCRGRRCTRPRTHVTPRAFGVIAAARSDHSRSALQMLALRLAREGGPRPRPRDHGRLGGAEPLEDRLPRSPTGNLTRPNPATPRLGGQPGDALPHELTAPPPAHGTRRVPSRRCRPRRGWCRRLPRPGRATR